MLIDYSLNNSIELFTYNQYFLYTENSFDVKQFSFFLQSMHKSTSRDLNKTQTSQSCRSQKRSNAY